MVLIGSLPGRAAIETDRQELAGLLAGDEQLRNDIKAFLLDFEDPEPRITRPEMQALIALAERSSDRL